MAAASFIIIVTIALICACYFSAIVLASFAFVFKKAERAWYWVLVPIKNILVLLEIVERPKSWIFLLIFPITMISSWLQVCIDLSRRFGRNTLFGICCGLVPLLFVPVLAFDQSQLQKEYEKPSSTLVFIGSLITLIGTIMLVLLLLVLSLLIFEKTAVFGMLFMVIFFLGPALLMLFGATAFSLGFPYSIVCLIVIMRKMTIGWREILIPFLNVYTLIKEFNRPRLVLMALLLIPVVAIPVLSITNIDMAWYLPLLTVIPVWLIINMDMAKAFGLPKWLGACGVLLPYVFYTVIAFGRTRYIGRQQNTGASTTESLG